MDNPNPPKNEKPQDQDRTLKDLTPNTAALLCYAGIWVSGIVLLILEQKNKFVRFHALQSIILFGSLTVAHIILAQIPFVGAGFSAIIFIIGAIFWIIMMIKAYAGESYKLPWVGNLAEKLANEVNATPGTDYSAPVPPAASQPSTQPNAPPVAQSSSPSTPQPSVQPLVGPASQSSSQTSDQPSSQTDRQQNERWCRQDIFRARYYSFRYRAARITGSAFAIAWSIAFIIFFNFYSNYIAYYSIDHTGGVDRWQMQTLVTSNFNLWLPIITATLILVIIGHTIMIIFDKYWLRQIIKIVLNIFTLASIISLLSIFPFDFSVLPSAATLWALQGFKVLLILISVGIVIGIIVRFIKFVVNLAEGRC
jgi:uncharacterized membrane protein